jgi:hypothetical protein
MYFGTGCLNKEVLVGYLTAGLFGVLGGFAISAIDHRTGHGCPHTVMTCPQTYLASVACAFMTVVLYALLNLKVRP